MIETQITRRGVRDRRVLAAMAWVPREWFVPPPLVPEAYQDGPLPIGNGQTISQPYVVAWMTEALAPRRRDRVLEIGTWPERAPFDGILVTAAAPRIPAALREQLAPGGRLVIPIGDTVDQELVVLRRTGTGFEERRLGGVRFVPLISRHAFLPESA